VFAVEDPNKVLLSVMFETRDGKQLSTIKAVQLDKFRSYGFQQPPPSDLNLVVAVVAPGVVRTEQFILADVELPWARH